MKTTQAQFDHRAELHGYTAGERAAGAEMNSIANHDGAGMIEHAEVMVEAYAKTLEGTGDISRALLAYEVGLLRAMLIRVATERDALFEANEELQQLIPDEFDEDVKYQSAEYVIDTIRGFRK